ncbi:MAG: ABC transporter substrate-binding protein [Actinomycetota bacterium]
MLRIPAPLLAVMVLAAVGCRSDPAPGGSEGDRAVAPVRGGNLVRALNYGDPGNLDPIVKPDVATQMVDINIFSLLVRYDPTTRELEPDLAESWEASDDARSYRLRLRRDAKFHNGRTVTPADVKYSFERLVNPKSASPSANLLADVAGARDFMAGAASEIHGIRVEGDVVAFTLDTPRPTFLLTLTGVQLSIVPREEVERAGQDFGRRPVGSGPFVFESWNPDDKIVLRANPSYFAGRPYLDRVTFRIMKEEVTRDAEFQTRKLDMMTALEPTYARYRANPRYRDDILEVPELFTRAIFFNTREKPFDDPRVRRAVNHAIDKRLAVKKVLLDKAYPAVGPLPRSNPAFNEDLEGYAYDPKKARALLLEAGLGDGFEMEVLASAPGARVMEGISSFFQEVGIRLKITQLEATTLLERARSGDFRTVYFSTGGEIDPVGFLENRLHSKNAGRKGNYTFYSNPRVDELLDEAVSTIDEGGRFKLARQAEEIVVADAPWFFFNYNKAAIIHQPWVRGLQPVPTDIDYQNLSKVWLAPREQR